MKSALKGVIYLISRTGTVLSPSAEMRCSTSLFTIINPISCIRLQVSVQSAALPVTPLWTSRTPSLRLIHALMDQQDTVPPFNKEGFSRIRNDQVQGKVIVLGLYGIG